TMTSACSVTATSRTGSAGGSHPHVRAQRHVAAFAHQLQLAILDQRVEPHPAFADRGHRVHDVARDVDHGEVLQPREGIGDAVPPEVGGTPAVVHHHDLPGTRAGLLDAGFGRSAQVDPQLDLAGVVAPPQCRLVLVAEAAAEL